MTESAKEAILEAARRTAQAHGYGGLNFRDIGAEVGIKAASIYHHFPSKADLGAAVAKRYWETTAAALESLSAAAEPKKALATYPSLFRHSLEENNRMCLCSFMAAEYDDLPDTVKTEVQAFADVNVKWLARMLAATTSLSESERETRARAIFAAVAGAQLMARSRADLSLFDTLIASFRESGLIPT